MRIGDVEGPIMPGEYPIHTVPQSKIAMPPIPDMEKKYEGNPLEGVPGTIAMAHRLLGHKELTRRVHDELKDIPER